MMVLSVLITCQLRAISHELALCGSTPASGRRSTGVPFGSQLTVIHAFARSAGVAGPINPDRLALPPAPRYLMIPSLQAPSDQTPLLSYLSIPVAWIWLLLLSAPALTW